MYTKLKKIKKSEVWIIQMKIPKHEKIAKNAPCKPLAIYPK